MTRDLGSGAKRRPSRARRRRPPAWSERQWQYDAELERVLREVRAIHDPASRAWQAGRVIALRKELHAIRRDAVRQLRARGLTWSEVGERLGISKGRAHALGR